jgi:hypothetical protein
MKSSITRSGFRLCLSALTIALALALSPPAANATEVGNARPFGLGVAVGTATTLVGKYFLDPGHALDFGIAFWRYRNGCWTDRRGVVFCDGYGSSYRHGGFGLHADYLWEEPLARRRAKLDWHIGVGARYWRFDDDYYYDDARGALAVRMPIGLDLTFVRPSFLELYVEAVPSLVVVPQVDVTLEAFLGVRFYF